MITKEFIIEYLKKYYKENKKNPLAKDKIHPFSNKTVQNRFGSWNKALIEADIPLLINVPIKVHCKQCNIEFIKRFSEIQKSENHFCSSSCFAIYNNKHRKTGNRVSKLELYLQEHLKGYNFDYSNRVVCNGLELDIYIDSLKLAFEINGIIHYQPIYGQDKLNNTIRKDILKNQICKDKSIILHTIKDESNKFNIKYGEIILNKINLLIHKHIFKETINKIQNKIGCKELFGNI